MEANFCRAVCHDCPWSTITFHRALQKPERSLAVPALGGKNFEDLAFVIHGAPEVARFTDDPDEHLVQVSSPVRIRLMMNPPFPDLGGEHRAEPVPPKPHRLMADVDATLMQQVLYLPKR